jgi:transcriptional regulator with XRE-family HTH domain
VTAPIAASVDADLTSCDQYIEGSTIPVPETTSRTMRSFESQLWEIRNDSGITFEDIADSMGVTPPYISQILRRGPSLQQVEKIAKALGIKPEKFDIYHVLSFERNVRDGDPLAHQYVQLMARMSQLPENRRSSFMTETLKQAAKARNW